MAKEYTVAGETFSSLGQAEAHITFENQQRTHSRRLNASHIEVTVGRRRRALNATELRAFREMQIDRLWDADDYSR